MSVHGYTGTLRANRSGDAASRPWRRVEENFNAYDFDDVHFYGVPRADTEPRDGKNYLIDAPPEMWIFHGTVATRFSSTLLVVYPCTGTSSSI